MARRALILGGGWAGVASAWRLAKAGYRVLLCEAGPRLGGRAGSFESGEGYLLDRGQHLFSAAYSTCRNLLRDIGTQDLVRYQSKLRVPFFVPGGEVRALEAGGGLGPLALLGGLGRFELLSPSSRRRLRWMGLRTGLDLLAAALGSSTRELHTKTVGQWLRAAGQDEDSIRLFWEPLCLAALNAPLEKAQALGMAQALASGFMRGGSKSGLGFPAVPLSALLEPAFETWLKEHGGEVRRLTRVAGLVVQGGRVARARLENGSELEAEVFVAALSHRDVDRLFDTEWSERLGLGKLGRLEQSPIVAVHLWTEQAVSEEMFGAFSAPAGEAQPAFHWMFQRDAIESNKAWRGRLFSFVASAADSLVQLEQRELRSKLDAQLKRWFPHYDPSKVTAQRVLKEKRATPLWSPGSEIYRRDPGESLPNLAFAGDWAQRGLPATLEGAARSGVAAAVRLGA